jgi:hypothetical protein
VKKVKKPPFVSSKGTSWGPFSSCQGDEDCVILEGSLEGKAFQTKVLTSVRKFLKGVEKENEDIPPRKANLEQMKLDLQVFALSLEGGMLDRKKSL